MVLRGQIKCAEWSSFLERLTAFLDHTLLFQEFSVFSFLQVLANPVNAPFGHGEIGQDQLIFHLLSVAGGVNVARRVGNPVVF